MILDQADTNYSNGTTIDGGVTVAASGIRLTNTDSGRIYGGVTFTSDGSTLINQLGGVISLSQFEETTGVLVSGSDGADTVVNEGLIKGGVALGGGADLFVSRGGSTYGLDLGFGDDTYRIEGSEPEMLSAAGGDGHDRLVFAGTAAQYWSGSLTGFEELVFESGGNFENFSGYQSISLTPPFADPLPFVNLLNCLNPAVDLTMDGQWLILNNSSLRSITGADRADAVELGLGSNVANGISLGGGDDTLNLDSNQSSGAPTITFPVSGGTGTDTLMLTWFTAGDRTYDLSSVQGFEKLNVNAWYIVDPATARVSHVSGLSDVDIGNNVTLILSDSALASARVGGGFGGRLTLEAGVVVDRYGFPEEGPWDRGLDIAQGDPARSTTIVNHGTINGAVRFYIGDDLYDGRDGTVGGRIYGNAGNDTLRGGAGAEAMEGGYGADILEGNGGADTLTGGFGADTFRDTAAGLNGDTITDFGAGDKIVISDATLAGFSFEFSGSTLTYTGGSLALSSAPGGRIVASVAPGGGVQLTIEPRAHNDVNGDGFSDMLWRNDSGQFNIWQSTSGNFVTSFTSAIAGNDWHIVGTGDFNGDARADIIWRHDSGQVNLWQATTNSGFVTSYSSSIAGRQWHVAGTGDFNGDGRDDIVWRHDNGQTNIWQATGEAGFVTSFSSTVAGAAWHIAGTGDFNGDGRDDIVWRHDTGSLNIWQATPEGSFITSFVSTIAGPSWHVAGTGDFDGDGRDDIAWRNDNGQFNLWSATGDGGFATSYSTMVGNDWHLVGAGDFNGDAKDDLVWRHDNGSLNIWQAGANGSFAPGYFTSSIAGNDWHVQDSFL